MRSRVLTCLTRLTCLLALAAPAVAAVVVPPPATAAASVRLVGNGYGHGHGMSQWGAQSQAVQGRTHRQILAFYYPGLTWGTTSARMRVWLSGDTTDDVVVVDRSHLKARSLGGGPTVTLGKPAARLWRVTAAAGGSRSRIAWKGRTGGWRTLRTVAGEVELRAGGRPITLVTPSGRHAYRGALRSARPSPSSGRRDTVNVVSLDEYVQGVVPREVYTSWRPAALRAQAVAARTYAAHERGTPLARHYDICDTTQCQVYGGVSGEAATTNAAIQSTSGQVLLHGGKPAFTQYSASNGGWVADGGQPYLVAKQDPYTQGDPNLGWTATISAAALQRAYPAIGTFRRVQVTKRDGNGQWGGRVVSIRIVGSRTSTTVSGDTFRSVFGLKSEWFTQR
jgi:stage II sporulation protein D